MICGTCCYSRYNAVASMQLRISQTAKYERGMKNHWQVSGQLHRPSTPVAASCATDTAGYQHVTLQKGHAQGSATPKASQETSYGFNLGKTTHVTVLVAPATRFLPVTALLCFAGSGVEGDLEKSSYCDNNTTVMRILLLIDIPRVSCRKSTGHWTSESQTVGKSSASAAG